MCGITRAIEDGDQFIVLRCDDDDYSPGFHRDSIFNLFWPTEETGVLAPIPLLPPKVLHAAVA